MANPMNAATTSAPVGIDDTVRRMRREIIHDVIKGLVPRTVRTFGELHNHRDANGYGGFLDDAVTEPLIAFFGGRDTEGSLPDGFVDFMNKAQDRTSIWLFNGGLEKECLGPGWQLADEATHNALNKWSNEPYTSIYQLRLGGSDGLPSLDLTVLQEDDRFLAAHGTVLMADKLDWPKDAAEVATNWALKNGWGEDLVLLAQGTGHRPRPLITSVNSFGTKPESEITIMKNQNQAVQAPSKLETGGRNTEEAVQFMDELLNSVESLGAVAEQYGKRTLVDLMYLQHAVLTGGFIDVYPRESRAADILRDLPSGKRWSEFTKVEFLQQQHVPDALDDPGFRLQMQGLKDVTSAIEGRATTPVVFSTDPGSVLNAKSDESGRKSSPDPVSIVVVMEGGQVQGVLADGATASVAVIEYWKQASIQDDAILFPQGNGRYERGTGSIQSVELAPERVAELLAAVERGPNPGLANVVSQGTFSGPVLSIVDGVVTQRVNRNGGTALHDASELSEAVGVGQLVEINYHSGKGAVKAVGQSAEVGR